MWRILTDPGFGASTIRQPVATVGSRRPRVTDFERPGAGIGKALGMVSNAELKERVEAAIEVQNLIDERNLNFGQQLIGLIDIVEKGQRQLQDEIDRHETNIERLNGENEQLREMLHSLLLAIESSGRDRLAEIIHKLDKKVSALVGTTPAVDELLPVETARQPSVHEEDVDARESGEPAEERAGVERERPGHLRSVANDE